MLFSSMFFLFLFMYFFWNNLFLSIEIPLINFISFNIPMSFLLDWMSCLFLFTVMFISSMILLFSIYYIPNSKHKQFSILLIMFVLSMSILIISDNIIFILLGWDGLGMSSYALVIFYQNFSSAASGTITILSNRLGDIMILISISILMYNMNWNLNNNENFKFIIIILLMIASCSKSAQFPFSAWLPAAMAAPTPISALVHSSTLVTAGIYLMIRIMNNFHPSSMFIMMIISSSTMIYSSMAANWEQDLKKIIALSTLSQIAMMMFAISMNSSILAFFHLIIHALFKSTMFLCAGIMIHSSSYQDMRMMGLNMYNMPMIPSILGMTNLTLMGTPFMSGFFSKDSIMEMLMMSKFNLFFTSLMIFSIGLTASYSFRMCMKSNYFSIKSHPNSISHKSLFSTIPIIILSPMSIMMGMLIMWILIPEQMFYFPIFMKYSIFLMISLGLFMGMNLSNKKPYLMLGQSAISLWFNHYISTSFMMNSPLLMSIFMNNDKLWQEMYGPKKSFTFIMNYSFMPDILKISILFTLIILFIMLLFMML
uniref:NADH-ubiquinone oxidoreductase chain 5 n=1 Tax=Amaurobius fenestralis TaxID=680006 RepID=A0A7L7S8R6_9ARAC|nr:NADH dehydrogenase subunit 5 [Amaurobius fenestralis]